MKRNTRTYKIEDKYYRKALRRGKGKLATMIEAFVSMYANGAEEMHLNEIMNYVFKNEGKMIRPLLNFILFDFLTK